jgi:hypothetical protein
MGYLLMIARIAEETNILSLSLPAVPSMVFGTKSSLLDCWCKSEPSYIVLKSSRLLPWLRMGL